MPRVGRSRSRQLGITDQTYYRWRKEYGSLKIDLARRLKDLERENNRLKKVVTDLTLDNAILKEAANPIFWARRAADRRWSGSGRESPRYRSAGRVGCRIRLDPRIVTGPRSGTTSRNPQTTD